MSLSLSFRAWWLICASAVINRVVMDREFGLELRKQSSN